MDKDTAHELLKTWTERRNAATEKTDRAHIALLVQEASWAYRCANYKLVGGLLSEATLQRQLSLH